MSGLFPSGRMGRSTRLLARAAWKPAGACAVALGLFAALCAPLPATDNAVTVTQAQETASGEPGGKWTVTVGKSLVIDSPLPIDRLSVADGNLADAVAINPREVLINGKAPGETSLIVWQTNGGRLLYDLTVTVSPRKLEAVREQIAHEYPDSSVSVAFENDTAFLRGTVPDVVAANRVTAIATTLGKVVNLLNVVVPPAEAQILVKVRFTSVDRAASRDLALNLASGAFNQTAAIGTSTPVSVDGGKSFSLSDAANIFLFRKDINLVAVLKALESKNLMQTLAEPTVPAINGKPASFTAGGQFPFPVVQPGANGGAISLQWRDYGVLLNFLPVVTPRGTIRLQVAPEVSSLDYAHSVTVEGFTVPGISTRRVQTEIELESGQSFVIAGLIDNQVTDSLSKIPGIGDIPILGKLFQSKTISRNNNELLVIVTPEIVRPIPAGQPLPQLNYPLPFMTKNTQGPISQPGMDVTGPVPVTPPSRAIPLEQLLKQEKQGTPEVAPNQPQYQLVPLPPSGASASGRAGASIGGAAQ